MNNAEGSVVKAVEELADKKVRIEQYGDLNYLITTSGAIPIFHDPRPEILCVNNLDALCAYVKEDPEGFFKEHTAIVVIDNFEKVSLMTEVYGEKGKRTTLLKAVANTTTFDFEQQMAIETFIIGIQACFVRDAETEKLLDFVSSVSIDSNANIQDNGVFQAVTVKNGITGKKEWAATPQIPILKPFRTFLEVDQPESSFVFRLRDSHGTPAAALYEADGGAWQLEAVKRIREYLKENLPDGAIIL